MARESALAVGSRLFSGPTGRARLVLVGSVVVSVAVLVAWFPASALFAQRSDIKGAESELAGLHRQDAALAQEKKNLSDTGEIGRVAREQYQLVAPGQEAFEVLPPSGAAAPGTPYAGDPGSARPASPSAVPELPAGGVTSTTGAAASDPRRGSTSPGAAATGSGGGVFSRMVHALEFWR